MGALKWAELPRELQGRRKVQASLEEQVRRRGRRRQGDGGFRREWSGVISKGSMDVHHWGDRRWRTVAGGARQTVRRGSSTPLEEGRPFDGRWVRWWDPSPGNGGVSSAVAPETRASTFTSSSSHW